jgi:hypothetical protein
LNGVQSTGFRLLLFAIERAAKTAA